MNVRESCFYNALWHLPTKSTLNYSEALQRAFPTEQWDNTADTCKAAGLLLRLKSRIYHALSNVLYTWTQSSAL